MKQSLHLLALHIDQLGGTVMPIKGPKGVPTGGLTTKGSTTFQTIIKNSATIIIVIAIVLALAFLIWGGVQWITSAGDKHKVEQARSRIIYSIIGLIVIFLSFFILVIIGGLFKINFFSL